MIWRDVTEKIAINNDSFDISKLKAYQFQNSVYIYGTIAIKSYIHGTYEWMPLCEWYGSLPEINFPIGNVMRDNALTGEMFITKNNENDIVAFRTSTDLNINDTIYISLFFVTV